MVLVLAAVITGLPVMAAAGDPVVENEVLVDFDDLVAGNGLTSGQGLTIAYDSKTGSYSKNGVNYEIVSDPADPGNKYLKFTQGTQDPPLAPTAHDNWKTSDYTQFSYSMDLKKDASFDSVPAYQFRARTHGVADDGNASRSEYVLFSLSSAGEIVFSTGTGIYLQEEVFLTVGVSVDFGVDQRYATVTGYIEGVPVQTWQLDAQGTRAYTADRSFDTWSAMKNAYAFTLNTWMSSPASGKNPGMLVDNVFSCTGLFTQYGNVCNLHLNGGALSGTFSGLYQYDRETRLPMDVSRADGALFAGWYDNAGFEGEAVTVIGAQTRGEVDYYAKWTDREGNLIPGVSVEYKLNGYGALPASGYDVTARPGDTQVTLPDVADLSNRRFLGWCTDAACEGEVYNGTYSDPEGITSDLVFYARWMKGFEADMTQQRPFPQWLDEENTSGKGGKCGIHFTTQDGLILISKEKVEGMTDGQMSATGLSVSESGILTIEIALSAVPGQPVVGMSLQTRGGDTTVLNVENGTGRVTVCGEELCVLDGDAVLITMVINLTDGTLDAYLDGNQYLDGFSYENGTAAADFNSLRLYFTENYYGQLRIHRFACADGTYFSYVSPTGVMMKKVPFVYSGSEGFGWSTGTEITLPDGLWIDKDGKLVSGTVALTDDARFRRVDVMLKEGASIRTNAPAGLRFESGLDSTVYRTLIDAGYTVTFGTYVFPADQYAGTLPENAVFSTFTDVGRLTLDAETGYYTYYTSLVELLDQNYARAFGAISYLTATREGESHTFTTAYAEVNNARSVYEVARAVASAGELAVMTEQQRAVVTGYLDAVVQISLTDPSSMFGATFVTVKNYTSPYNDVVYIMNGAMQISGSAEKLCAVILNGKVYTSGWTATTSGYSIPIPDGSDDTGA